MEMALVDSMEVVANELKTRACVVTGRGRVYQVAEHRSNREFDPVKRRHASTRDYLVHYFNAFINFSKPVVAALNGSAYGGAATSTSHCDHVIAIEDAELSFPFKRWHVVAEGCSTVHLARLSGQARAAQMLHGWIPQAVEAQRIGLIDRYTTEVSGSSNYLDAALALATKWATAGQTRTPRTIDASSETLEDYRCTNGCEEDALGLSFIDKPCLASQVDFFGARMGADLLHWRSLAHTSVLYSLVIECPATVPYYEESMRWNQLHASSNSDNN